MREKIIIWVAFVFNMVSWSQIQIVLSGVATIVSITAGLHAIWYYRKQSERDD